MKACMLEEKSAALEYFLKHLLQSGIKSSIGKIFLFGSLARKEAREESDIDLLIFAANQLEAVERACDTASFETALQFSESIEPVIYCLDELRHPHSYFTFKVIKEGEELYAMDNEEMKKEEAFGYLDLAQEYLDLAEYNLEGKYYRGTIDAAYNSTELCAKGCILLKLDFVPTSHGGVVQKFGELFVKTKIVSDTLGRSLRKGLRLRNIARYDPHARIAKEDAQEAIALAKSLVEVLKQQMHI